mgnify:CR=1 FL=1
MNPWNFLRHGPHEEGHGMHRHRFGRHLGQRMFENGDVRYVILALLAERPSYGYELIKAIEMQMSGAYSPSPGIIYPTLAMLVELGYVSEEVGNEGKKRYSVTRSGADFLKENKPVIDLIFGRMAHVAELHKRAASPEIVNAMENLKGSLRAKCTSAQLTDLQIQTIASAIEEATKKIEQC